MPEPPSQLRRESPGCSHSFSGRMKQRFLVSIFGSQGPQAAEPVLGGPARFFAGPRPFVPDDVTRNLQLHLHRPGPTRTIASRFEAAWPVDGLDLNAPSGATPRENGGREVLYIAKANFPAIAIQLQGVQLDKVTSASSSSRVIPYVHGKPRAFIAPYHSLASPTSKELGAVLPQSTIKTPLRR